MGRIEGREAIRSEAATMKDSMARVFGEGTVLRHFATNIAIRVEGDRAWTRAAWFEAYNNGPGGAPVMGSFGHYEDELARVDGEWLFRFRKIFNEFLDGRKGGDDNPVVKMEIM